MDSPIQRDLADHRLNGCDELQPLAAISPRRSSPAKQLQAEWSRCYKVLCLCVALCAGASPLLGLATYAAFRSLSEGHVQDAICDGSIFALSRLGLNSSVVQGASFALATYTDDGPRGEYRRVARLALSNKRAYALLHGYSLHVFTSRRPECLRRGGASLRLLVLQELMKQDTHEWLFWVDPDVMIVEQSIPLPTIMGMRGTQGGGRPGLINGIPQGPSAAKPHARMVVSTGAERDLALSAVLLDARSPWSTCLLAHAAAMRRCLARGARFQPAILVIPALLALLRPRTEHERECIQQPPRGCDLAALSAAGLAQPRSAAAGSSAEPFWHGQLSVEYMDHVMVLPRPVLNGEPATYREGDFVVHISGCVVGHRGRSLKWCDATFTRFQNLSRWRSREARVANAAAAMGA